jgi:hypothetical protein
MVPSSFMISQMTAEVDRGFRMAGPHQHAALARDEWEDVAGRDEVGSVLGRIDGGGNGARAIVGGDAGGVALARLDRLREGGAVARGVAPHHRLQLQLLGARLSQGQADEAASVLGHEVDGVGRRHLRRHDEVALVLPLLRVDEHHHAPVAHVLENLGDGGQAAAALREGDGAEVVGHGRNSKSRAT